MTPTTSCGEFFRNNGQRTLQCPRLRWLLPPTTGHSVQAEWSAAEWEQRPVAIATAADQQKEGGGYLRIDPVGAAEVAGANQPNDITGSRFGRRRRRRRLHYALL